MTTSTLTVSGPRLRAQTGAEYLPDESGRWHLASPDGSTPCLAHGCPGVALETLTASGPLTYVPASNTVVATSTPRRRQVTA